MIEIWDYFMRRKKLLCLVLALFFASSLLSYQALHQETSPTSPELQTPQYITIADWGIIDSEPEPDFDPATTIISEPTIEPYTEIISPTEVAELPKAQSDYILPEPEYIPSLVASSPILTPEVPNLGGETTEASSDFILSDIILSLLGTVSLALCAYLTYQHFTR